MQAVLGSIVIACQGHADVVTLGGRSPISLYLLTIAKSGERKSKCDSLALEPIRRFEQRKLARFRQQHRAFESPESKELTVIEGDDGACSSDATIPSRPPINPTILFGNTTLEALPEHFSNGNPSVAIANDDAGQFFGGYSMKRENKIKSSGDLCRMWDGAAIDRHRAGSGSVTLSGRRVSVLLMLQPDIANFVLADPVMVGQGLVPRMLIAYPESKIGTRLIETTPEWKETRLQARKHLEGFHQRIEEILTTPLLTRRGDPLALVPKPLSLSPGAERIVVEYYNKIERASGSGGAFAHMDGTASKTAEQACRIAGNFQIFADLKAECVDEAAMQDGCALAQWYLQEMKRLRDVGLVSSEMREAEHLRKWLFAQRKGQIVTARDIARNGPRPTLCAEKARQLMSILVNHDCVELQRENSTVDGRKAKWSWRVK